MDLKGKTHSELVAERDRLLAEGKAILDRCGEADLTGDDAERFDQITTEVEPINGQIARLERKASFVRGDYGVAGDRGLALLGPDGGMRYRDGTPVPGYELGYGDEQRRPQRRALAGKQVLTRDQTVDQWTRDNGYVKHDEPLSFDRYLRGIVIGNWENAEQERALSEGTLTAGGHLVPTPLAGNVIDLMRNATRVIQAGAVTIPMTSQTLKVARLTGEGAPAWRNENAAVTAGDLTFDAVTFTARSLDRLVIMSRELFEDSDPSASDVIARSFAAQMALELDRVALRGTGTAPEPRGVLNTSGVTLTAHGANGTAITTYDWWLDAAGVVRNSNFEPNAHIQAPRTTTSLSKLKEATTNAYLAPPATLLPMLPTKQVPVNLTVGTSTDCSEVYTGQWDQLAIGIRTDFELRALPERYADNQQIGFLAHMRADVQVLQPTAFTVDTGVRA
jgi:HK97 family phage major capsid protein